MSRACKIALTLAALIVGVVLLWRFAGADPEPEYGGLELSEWFAKQCALASGNFAYTTGTNNPALALRAMGTNAAIYLLSLSETPVNPRVREIIALTRRELSPTNQTLNSLKDRLFGVASFPEISEPFVRQQSLAAIVNLELDASALLPLITPLFTNQNAADRFRALTLARGAGSGTNLVIPHLIRALSDPNPDNQNAAVESYSQLRLHVPDFEDALLALFKNSPTNHQLRLVRALQIQPPIPPARLPLLSRLLSATSPPVSYEIAIQILSLDHTHRAAQSLLMKAIGRFPNQSPYIFNEASAIVSKLAAMQTPPKFPEEFLLSLHDDNYFTSSLGQLLALGLSRRTAIQKLETIPTSADPNNSLLTAEWLLNLQPGSRRAIDILTDLARTPFRSDITRTHVEDYDIEAILRLGTLGTNAAPVIPVLIDLLTNAPPEKAAALRSTLSRILPSSADEK